jgi:hypothetical protein
VGAPVRAARVAFTVLRRRHPTRQPPLVAFGRSGRQRCSQAEAGVRAFSIGDLPPAGTGICRPETEARFGASATRDRGGQDGGVRKAAKCGVLSAVSGKRWNSGMRGGGRSLLRTSLPGRFLLTGKFTGISPFLALLRLIRGKGQQATPMRYGQIPCAGEQGNILHPTGKESRANRELPAGLEDCIVSI